MVDILFASTFKTDPEDWIGPLRTAIPRAHIVNFSERGASAKATIAIAFHPPASLFEHAPNIQAIFNLGAGVDALMRLPGLREDTLVFRLEDAGMAVQMAEYAVYGVLRITRHFAAYERQSRQGHWEQLPAIRRRDWPVGILGLGVMGARVAQTLVGLDYLVAGWSRGGKALAGVEDFADEEGLDAFLARTRILINTLPLTPETTGILNQSTLAKLKSGAHLINVGRGEHLVEPDLRALLDAGQLQGAMLDVFTTEPLPAEHPFWRDQRILITPHMAAASLHDETIDQVARKVNAYLDGEPVSGVVTRRRGY